MLAGDLYVVSRAWDFCSVKVGPHLIDDEIARVSGGSVVIVIDERRGPYGRYVALVLYCNAFGWVYFDQLEVIE